MPTLLQHSMVSGDTATPIQGPAVHADGTPFDLTGCFVRYVARYSEGDGAETVIDKSTADGSVVCTGTAYRVDFDHADTSDLENRNFPHEIEVTSLSGAIETIARGALQLTRDYAA